MISSYLGYRWQLFACEIKHWLAQLSGVMLLLLAVLGTAIPVLLYLVMVGFGMLAEEKFAVDDAILFVASILLFQSVILDVCQSAITGAQFNEFNASLTTNSWLIRSSDCALAILCNPMVLLNLLLLSSAGVAAWIELQHMLLLLLLQIVLTIMIFSSAFRTYLIIACCFLCSYMPFFTAIDITLLVVLMFSIGCTITPTVTFNIAFKQYSTWAFWLDFWRINRRVPVLVLAVSILTLFIAHGFEQQRPDLSEVAFLVAGQFLILVTSVLQVELNKLQAEHSAFYQVYVGVVAFSRARDLLLVAAVLLIFVLLWLVSAKPGYGFLQFLMSLCCLWVARRKSAYLIYSWLVSCALMALLQHVVMAR